MAEKLCIVLAKVQLSVLFLCLFVLFFDTFQQTELILKKQNGIGKMWHHSCRMPLSQKIKETKKIYFVKLPGFLLFSNYPCMGAYAGGATR
jgi:hypothetical protein